MNHFNKTLNAISRNQWFGLFLGQIIAILAWTKLVFIISPLKGGKIKIGKYQVYALMIGMFISLIAWAKLLSIVDPIKNECICKCN